MEMTKEEEIALKAACVQAAAALLVAQYAKVGGPSSSLQADTVTCTRYAKDLYQRITGQAWP
jgi:hypothetical protein